MNWEEIDPETYRAKIFGGWLVKTVHDAVTYFGKDQPAEWGYQWRSAITFVPDPNHEWKIEL